MYFTVRRRWRLATVIVLCAVADVAAQQPAPDQQGVQPQSAAAAAGGRSAADRTAAGRRPASAAASSSTSCEQTALDTVLNAWQQEQCGNQHFQLLISSAGNTTMFSVPEQQCKYPLYKNWRVELQPARQRQFRDHRDEEVARRTGSPVNCHRGEEATGSSRPMQSAITGCATAKACINIVPT